MKITSESHLDHGLTQAHLDYLQTLYPDTVEAELIKTTITMPDSLPTLDCALYGPVMGDGCITAAFHQTRPGRQWVSRVIRAVTRPTRLLTLIAGPDGPEGALTLYTSYGGPEAPREPMDPSIVRAIDPKLPADMRERVLERMLTEAKEAAAFWAVHAIAVHPQE